MSTKSHHLPGMSDYGEEFDWSPALVSNRMQAMGPGRKLLRKWLQQAWGRHFDPDQGLMWDLVQTLGLPYKFCTDVLYPIIKWFWDLRKILFNPDRSFKENWEELKWLGSSILANLKQVQRRPEKTLTQDKIEWEEFLGPSLEPRIESFKYDPLEYSRGGSTIRVVELLPGKVLDNIECRLRSVVLQPPGVLEIRTTINIQERSLDVPNQSKEQENHVDYQASSYYWGDNTASKTPIACNAECRLRSIVLQLPGELEIGTAIKTQESLHVPNQSKEPETHVDYEALSYCWGDNTALKTPIVCNGARLEITRNLKSALQHLRDEEKVRVLWIDAICINQEDLVEREQQVGYMREIYQQAERVVVWVGESADDSDSALSLCARIALIAGFNIDEVAEEELNYRMITSSWPKDYTWNSREARRAAGAILKMAGESTGEVDFLQVLRSRSDEGYDDTIEKAELFALQNLVKRPWFTRMWITQEIGVAKEAILVCGKTTIDWGLFDLGYSLTLLTADMRRYLTKDIVENGMGRLTVLRRILTDQDKLTTRQEKLLTLPVLLNSFRKHKATDPRDKVFALFGLTSTDTKAMNLHPDYRSSVEDVYKNVAKALMKSSKSLYILSIPRSNTDLSRRLPSWIPDWSDTLSHPKMFSRDSESTDTMSPVPIPTYKASNGSQLSPQSISKVDNTLHLSGYIVDKIAHLSEVYAPPTYDWLASKFQTFTTISPWDHFLSMLTFFSDYSHCLDVLHDWRAQALSPGRTAATAAALRETYWRTLSADWTPDGAAVAASDFARFDKQFYPIAFLRAVGLRKVFPRLYRAGLFLGVAGDRLLRGTDTAFSNMMECAVLRRLAWTEGGRLALVPRESRVGDALVLVQGGDMPLVVRRVGGGEEGGEGSRGKWTLVGDSYVHGIMYGEAWDEGRCEEIDLV